MADTDSLEPCPHCGKDDFGNAGARTNHVRACEREAEKYQQSADQSQPPQQAHTPVVQDEQPRQGSQSQGNLPAAQGASDGLQLGASLGNLATVARGGSPEEKAQVQSEVLRAGAGALAQVAQSLQQEKIEGAQRSKQASQDQLQQVDKYVRCPECDGQITNLPEPGVEFECPTCGELLELSP